MSTEKKRSQTATGRRPKVRRLVPALQEEPSRTTNTKPPGVTPAESETTRQGTQGSCPGALPPNSGSTTAAPANSMPARATPIFRGVIVQSKRRSSQGDDKCLGGGGNPPPVPALSDERAKAITLTHLNRPNSPPGTVARVMEQRFNIAPEDRTNDISGNLCSHFWWPPEPPDGLSCFSPDIHTECYKKEQSRFRSAVWVIEQLAFKCLPSARVNYEEFEKALGERAKYFRPTVECVLVDFADAWECDPRDLEQRFGLSIGEAELVLQVLQRPNSTDLLAGFIQVENLLSPYWPHGPLKWPSPPYHIRPAPLAWNFLSLLEPHSRRPSRPRFELPQV